jgi:16S rRNA U1498 N3-methylase RsmE
MASTSAEAGASEFDLSFFRWLYATARDAKNSLARLQRLSRLVSEAARNSHQEAAPPCTKLTVLSV